MKLDAVLTGVNVYKFYADDTLRGCVPDVQHLWMLLADKMRWPLIDAVVLKDAAAAELAEKQAVLNMIADSQGGNHFVWSHSSHGTNNPDAGQKDGLEELLCCYDIRESGGLWSGGFISARWIGDLALKVHPNDTLDIILDCCHAPEGGQLKGLGLSYDRARFLPRSVVGAPVDPATVKPGSLPPNVALWSACQPEQTSADAYIGQSWQGAFTAAFLASWRARRSRSDIIFYARKWLKDNRYQQIPHLYCGPAMAQREFGA